MQFRDILYLISIRKKFSSKVITTIYYNLFLLKKESLDLIFRNFFVLDFVERFLLSLFFSNNVIIALLFLPSHVLQRLLMLCFSLLTRDFNFVLSENKFSLDKINEVFENDIFIFSLRSFLGVGYFRLLKRVILFNYKLNFLLHYFFLLFSQINFKRGLKLKLLRAICFVNKNLWLNKTLKRSFRIVTKGSYLNFKPRLRTRVYSVIVKKYFLHYFVVDFFKKRYSLLRFRLKRYPRRFRRRFWKLKLSRFKTKVFALNSFDWFKKRNYFSLLDKGSLQRIYSFYSFRYSKPKNSRFFFFVNKLNFLLDKVNENYSQFKNIIFFMLSEFRFFMIGDSGFINVDVDKKRKKNQYFFNLMNSRLLSRIKLRIKKYILKYKQDMKKRSSALFLFSYCYKVLNSIVSKRVVWEKKLKKLYELYGTGFYNKKVRNMLNLPYSGKLSLLENVSSLAKRHVLVYSKLRKKYKGKIFAKIRSYTRMRSLVRILIGRKLRIKRYSRYNYDDFVPFKFGTLHFKFVFNNVFMTLTGNKQNEVVFKLSSGIAGYKGAAKSTAYTRSSLINKAIDEAYDLDYKVLDLKFLMRPQHWFFEAFMRKFMEKRMGIRFMFYHPFRIHGYLRFRKKRYL